MGFPELQVSTGDQGGSYGIVKNIFDSKLSNNAGLVVGYPKLLCHLVASLWRKYICGFDGSVTKSGRNNDVNDDGVQINKSIQGGRRK